MPAPIIFDHGPLLNCKCPGCKEAQVFNLIEETIHSTFFKKLFLFFDRKIWTLNCEKCNYKCAVTEPEAAIVQDIRQKVKSSEDAKKAVEEFQTILNQLKFVNHLICESLAWDCPKCKQSVSFNLDACWNCYEPHPQFKGEKHKAPVFIPPMSCCG